MGKQTAYILHWLEGNFFSSYIVYYCTIIAEYVFGHLSNFDLFYVVVSILKRILKIFKVQCEERTGNSMMILFSVLFVGFS